ncbi:MULTISPECIES: gene transfer agent family protein [unclassified Bradyrhizobium]|uniref:gene transfer agent family protein n=1 Tax=unclassified Bradyrhizobium TaxID=2631580 RepID=UPI0028E8EF72|nr:MULTISPECIES: gene transfer agent family protein [unclassified Bradyrhizobium]
MSADGGICFFWGDDEYRFRLAIGQFRELQECINLRRLKIGAPIVGPMRLLNELRVSDAWPDDVRDVIRLGLVGGGMEPKDAHRLLRTYFDDVDRYPPLTHMRPAFLILTAGFTGPIEARDTTKDDADAQKKSARAMTTATPTPQSTSDASTAPEPP